MEDVPFNPVRPKAEQRRGSRFLVVVHVRTKCQDARCKSLAETAQE
jgi:hypothetical protein